jgi:hypothetical protein
VAREISPQPAIIEAAPNVPITQICTKYRNHPQATPALPNTARRVGPAQGRQRCRLQPSERHRQQCRTGDGGGETLVFGGQVPQPDDLPGIRGLQQPEQRRGRGGDVEQSQKREPEQQPRRDGRPEHSDAVGAGAAETGGDAFVIAPQQGGGYNEQGGRPDQCAQRHWGHIRQGEGEAGVRAAGGHDLPAIGEREPDGETENGDGADKSRPAHELGQNENRHAAFARLSGGCPPQCRDQRPGDVGSGDAKRNDGVIRPEAGNGQRRRKDQRHSHGFQQGQRQRRPLAGRPRQGRYRILRHRVFAFRLLQPIRHEAIAVQSNRKGITVG